VRGDIQKEQDKYEFQYGHDVKMPSWRSGRLVKKLITFCAILAGAQEFDSSQNELLWNNPSRRGCGRAVLPYRNWETAFNEAVAQIRTCCEVVESDSRPYL